MLDAPSPTSIQVLAHEYENETAAVANGNAITFRNLAPTFRAGSRLAPDCQITPADVRSIWQKIRKPALANNYQLVAVHTPWSLAIDPAGRSKRPLVEIRGGKKLPWTLGHSDERLRSVTALSANTGTVLGGASNLIALDYDPPKDAPEDEQRRFALDLLRMLRDDPLGALLMLALMRLREPASVLLLLRTDAPLTKHKVKGSRGQVEQLGLGGHCIIDGWHNLSLVKTRPVRWRWRNGRAPWNTPISEVPRIPADGVLKLLHRIEASGVLGETVPHFHCALDRNSIGAQHLPKQNQVDNYSCAPVPRNLGGRGEEKNTRVVVRRPVYSVTERLHHLFDRHDGCVKPAIREVVEQIGAEGSGRHDAIVAICGRLILQRWTDQQAHDFLVPLVNQHFQEGDWSIEVQQALDHARKREAESLSRIRGVTWPR